MKNDESLSLLVRADAGLRMGVGHVMRCIALGQAWRQLGGKVCFASGEMPSSLHDRLVEEHFCVETIQATIGSRQDACLTLDLASAHDVHWVALDGYHFDAAFQQVICSDKHRVLLIDDYAHLDEYMPDVLLNQNLHASESMYPRRASHLQLLLGLRFALLRREFLMPLAKATDIRADPRVHPDVARRLLVTLGGSDPQNATGEVLQALLQIDDPQLQAVIVIGASNPHFDELQAVTGSAEFDVRLEQNSTRMPELMRWADIAISAGGSTCWELACLGLPHLVLVIAENQEHIAAALAHEEPDINLGWLRDCSERIIADRLIALMHDRPRRQRLSERGQEMIDGKGSLRVAQTLWDRAQPDRQSMGAA